MVVMADSPAENRSWRHHYVPQFLLKNFAAPDGSVWTLRRVFREKLASKRYSTIEIGYEADLFSVFAPADWMRGPAPDWIERQVFAPIDDVGARLCQKLIDEGELDTDDERRGWATFINSLYERSPRLL